MFISFFCWLLPFEIKSQVNKKAFFIEKRGNLECTHDYGTLEWYHHMMSLHKGLLPNLLRYPLRCRYISSTQVFFSLTLTNNLYELWHKHKIRDKCQRPIYICGETDDFWRQPNKCIYNKSLVLWSHYTFRLRVYDLLQAPFWQKFSEAWMHEVFYCFLLTTVTCVFCDALNATSKFNGNWEVSHAFSRSQESLSYLMYLLHFKENVHSKYLSMGAYSEKRGIFLFLFLRA